MKIKNFRIKPHFSIIAHNENTVELRSGVWNPTSFTINDKSQQDCLLSIIQSLNGHSSAAEIAEKNQIARSEVEGVIDHLHQLNVLESSVETTLDFYINDVIPTLTVSKEQNLESTKRKIMIISDTKQSTPLYDLLKQHLPNHCLHEIKKDDPLMAVLTDEKIDRYDGLSFQRLKNPFLAYREYFFIFLQTSPNPNLCSTWNLIANELAIPWIHAAMDGPFLLIGPTFHSSGPCFDCFEKRIMMNLKESASYQKYKIALAERKILERETLCHSLLMHMLVSHVAMESINYVLTRTNFTKGKVLSIYLPTMEIAFNEVLQETNCPTCASHPLRDGRQPYFDIHTLIEE